MFQYQNLLILAFCTAKLAVSDSEPGQAQKKLPAEFTFDLSSPAKSNFYSLKHRRNFSTTTAVLLPNGDSRLTKIVDATENVVQFSQDQIVTKLVFSPADSPSVLSVTYIRRDSVLTRRFRKLYGWFEVTLEEFNYLMFDLTKAPVDVTLDLSNVDREKFGVKQEQYGSLTLYNITTPRGYKATRVVDGSDVLWESKGDEKVSYGFVSVQSTPRLASFAVMTGNMLEMKAFATIEGKFHEVCLPEFNRVLDTYYPHFALDLSKFAEKEERPAETGPEAKPSTSGPEQKDNELELDLASPDTCFVEVSYGLVDGVPFVNLHPLPDYKVTKVTSNSYLLWSNADRSTCLNVSYSLNQEPRMFNLLVSPGDGSGKDYTLLFMAENGFYYSLPHEEYVEKLARSFSPSRYQPEATPETALPYLKRSKEREQFDVEVLLDKAKSSNTRTLLFTPAPGSRMNRVVSGKDLLWLSEDERLDRLYLFKNDDKLMVQLSLLDAESNTSTKYFSYTNQTGPKFSPHYKGAGLPEHEAARQAAQKEWLWVSGPEFFRNVLHTQLVNTYVSLDMTKRVDMGVMYHKKGTFHTKVVRTFTTYPSYYITSLFDGDKFVWSSGEGEEALAVALYYSESESNKTRLVEIFVRRGDDVVRDLYAFTGNAWESVREEYFRIMYKDL